MDISPIKWTIERVDRRYDHRGKKDVVIGLHYRAHIGGGGKSVDHDGFYAVPLSEAADFTAYENLTEEQMLGWLFASFEAEDARNLSEAKANGRPIPVKVKQAKEDTLRRALDGYLKPKTETSEPPWRTAETS